MALVLVLEDNPSMQFTFAQALEAEGHTVLTAEDTAAALALLRRHTPDILLLDLLLDDDISTDVANYARFAAPNARVVYVTGSGLFPKGELFNMSQNAHLVLRKPVRMDELTNLIDHLIPPAKADAAQTGLRA